MIWITSLVCPALMLFPNLPDSVMLVVLAVCLPNFISDNSSVRVWLFFLVAGALSSIFIVFFCYGSIYHMYVRALKRRFQRGQKNFKLPARLSANASNLLLKFGIISGAYVATFLPIIILFIVLLVKPIVISEVWYVSLIVIHQLSSVLNPYLLYFLDARLKLTINEMLGINRFFTKPDGPAAARNIHAPKPKPTNTQVLDQQQKINDVMEMNIPGEKKPDTFEPVDTVKLQGLNSILDTRVAADTVKIDLQKWYVH
jgi:hypothetical protein